MIVRRIIAWRHNLQASDCCICTFKCQKCEGINWQYLGKKESYDANKRAKRPMIGQIYKNIPTDVTVPTRWISWHTLLHEWNHFYHPDVRRETLSGVFQVYSVDEYQDTNFAQHLIVSTYRDDMKLCIVGDDAQSIYLSGSEHRNIINPQKALSGSTYFQTWTQLPPYTRIL